MRAAVVSGSPMRVPVATAGKPSAIITSPAANSSSNSGPSGEDALRQLDERNGYEEGGVAEELRLVGDLASAEVGVIKRFSIDLPRSNVDCDVVVTGQFPSIHFVSPFFAGTLLFLA
jgi:hypothetical protein